MALVGPSAAVIEAVMLSDVAVNHCRCHGNDAHKDVQFNMERLITQEIPQYTS